MLNVNVTTAFRWLLGVGHHHGRGIVYPYGSAAMLMETQLLKNGPKHLGSFACTDCSDELSFSLAGANGRNPFSTVDDSSSG